jgi:uncharacterized SAM-binding protein YcdF (DUF218 family)
MVKPRRAAGWKWVLTLVLLAGGALAACFLGAGYFLEAPAQAPARADLLAALGGDNGARADKVLELYRKGLAPRVLLTGPESHSKTRSAFLNMRARYLVEEGVPEKAILFDRSSRNSWEEAASTLRLMRELKLERVLVVSDPPHMRRLAWVWGKVFAGSGREFVLVASDMDDWDAGHWWRTSASAQFVFGEYIKLAYYVVQY